MPAGDPNYAYRVLGIHCNGANGSTTFVDKSPSPKRMTTRGSAAIATDSGAIGGVSLSVGGSGAAVDAVGDASCAFGTGAFDVSFFLKTTDTAGGIVDFYTGGQPGWQVYLEAGKIAWYYNATRLLLSTAAVNDGVRRHIRIARSGTTIRLFIDGVLNASATDSNNYSHISPYLSIGRQYSGSPSTATDLIGNINEVLIYKGVALNTADFSPPTSAFLDGSHKLSGTVTDQTGAVAARLVRAFREDTGVFVGEATSSPVTGVYEIYTESGAHTLTAYPGSGESLPALALRGVIPV